MTAFLAHRHVRHPGVLDQDLMQMVLVGERPDRCQVPQEHLRAVTIRPTMADVVDHRPADLPQQRQLHAVTGLGLRHEQPLPGQSKSANSSRLMSTPRSPSLVISRIIA